MAAFIGLLLLALFFVLGRLLFSRNSYARAYLDYKDSVKEADKLKEEMIKENHKKPTYLK